MNYDWFSEHTFWCKKFSAASDRWFHAESIGDFEAMKIAGDQMRLYHRRGDALIPQQLKDQWEAERERDRKLAIDNKI